MSRFLSELRRGTAQATLVLLYPLRVLAGPRSEADGARPAAMRHIRGAERRSAARSAS
jgi:hypothetical protein